MSLRSRLIKLLPVTAVAVLTCSLGVAVGSSPSVAAEGVEATDDGLLLYADSTWTGTYSLISADGSTWQRGARDLFRDGQVIDADFSPDGGSIAFLRTCATCEPVGSSQPTELRVLTAGDTRDRLLSRGLSTTNSSGRIYADALAWSADGSEIATFESPGIVAIDVTTGAKRTLLVSGDGIAINSYRGLSWSTNGEIAFVGSSPDCTSELCSRNDLYTFDAGAGSDPQIFGRYPGDDDPDDECAPRAGWTRPAWSPDGQTLAAYLSVERRDCPDDPGTRLCSLQLAQADRAESVPTTLRVLSSERDCYGDDSSAFFEDLMEPRWSESGDRLLAAWNVYHHFGIPVGVIVDVDGPDQPVTTLGDLDPAMVYAQLPLPFDWQPCPGGTCVEWAPVSEDRIAQTAVACGRTAFRWVGPRGQGVVGKGERSCTFVLSNAVAHDLLRLAEGAGAPREQVFGVLVLDQIGPHRHSHQADSWAEPVLAQLETRAEDWVIDRMAAKLATTSPRWLRRAFGVDTYDGSPGDLPTRFDRQAVLQDGACLQFDVRLVGEQQLVRSRVVGAGRSALTWRTQRVNGRRTTVPVRLGLSCTARGDAAIVRRSSAWTRASQERTLFRARWDG